MKKLYDLGSLIILLLAREIITSAEWGF